ncbi:flagellar motor protein MotB [Tabrizicola sp.]|uniref:flagellar motor protein MotB n=1 Tax=Tabrizicola sp. TaxID=2005166 RepID=UPI0035B4A2BF
MPPQSNNRPIIKKVKKVSGGHHGGNWKVAYADFMTAMMAFFLLLWILSVSDAEKLSGIADYFTPAAVPMVDISGFDPAAAPIRDALETQPPVPDLAQQELPPADPPPNATGKAANPWTAFEEGEAESLSDSPPHDGAADPLGAAQAAIEETMATGNPLESLAGNLMVARTPDGLLVEIVDLGDRPMFRSGSAEVTEVLARVLKEFSTVIAGTPMAVSITGHTDASPYRGRAGYGNWELSADRANAARRLLEESGVPADRFRSVGGMADVAPLIVEDPVDPRNRRITIELQPIAKP